jgi:putative Mn2+ efflux pump MntP
MWAAVALAFGLAMDATAVSAARGLAQQRPGEVVILPLLFGGFQAGMAALGWLAGVWVGPYISAWDHWVAFGLLVAIGGKMVVEAWRNDDGTPPPPGTPLLYLGLAVATSIDAAAAGITLPLVPAPPWLSLVLIGTITAACTVGGHTAGRYAGERFGARLAILGGVVLIAIAFKLLIQGS